ncbi:MAG: hypothetical protein QM504_17250 [Pseudomonadota bacterium]
MKLYKIFNNPLFLIVLLLFNSVASFVYSVTFDDSMFLVLGSITGAASVLGFYSYFFEDKVIDGSEKDKSILSRPGGDSGLNIDKDTVLGMPHDPSVNKNEERSLFKKH